MRKLCQGARVCVVGVRLGKDGTAHHLSTYEIIGSRGE